MKPAVGKLEHQASSLSASLSEYVINLGAHSLADVLFGEKHHISLLDKKAISLFTLADAPSVGWSASEARGPACSAVPEQVQVRNRLP